MQIQELKVLKGPNYWSIRRPKLIQMKLDLEDLEYRPSNKIEGFRERIEQLIPTLIEHQCSEGHRGGFFKRVEDGTWMGHIIEHIALEVQSLAGMNCGFGRTRSTGERDGIYNVVFEYDQEEAGIYTAKAAVQIAQALVNGIKYNIEADILALKRIHKENRLPSSLTHLIREASKRNIPYMLLDNNSLIQLGYGNHQKQIHTDRIKPASGILIEDLFAKGNNGRIPIISIAGSRGKTLTSLLIAHIAQAAGKNVGRSTSNYSSIQNHLTFHNNCTERDAAQLVLIDPTVDFAVLPCDHQSILTSGLAFQKCDVAIVTNITSDYVGSNNIRSIEQLVRVIQVVPETVSDQGYAILNADDDLVYKMQEDLSCKIALFSISECNSHIRAHCEKGNKAAILENGFISVLTGSDKVQLMPVEDIPIASDRKNIDLILAAVLSTYLFQDITLENIRQALQTFTPLSTHKPEMLNFSN